MNIFVLDHDIKKCAQYHCDKHVVKMILETAQMLCTAANLSGVNTRYKTTHVNHPCNVWARTSLSNWLWLRCLCLELNEEYKYRYNKCTDHKSAIVAFDLREPELPDEGLTRFALSMPDRYKLDGVVDSYRNYYINEKLHFAKWTRRSCPDWVEGGANDFD